MKTDKLFKVIFLILFIIFISIYVASSSGYYEYSNNKKTMFTEEKIKQFEQDVAEGKNIKVEDYLTDETKDYSNKVTRLGDSVSDFINSSVNTILKKGFELVEDMIN